MSFPSAMSAVDVGTHTWVFFVKPDGTLYYVSSRKAEKSDPTAATSQEHTTNSITVKDPGLGPMAAVLMPPTNRTPVPYNQISAVNFSHADNTRETHVFYVGPADPQKPEGSEPIIKDIRKVGDTGPWEPGVINIQKFHTTSDTLITAIKQGGHLRVYFQRGLKKQLHVAMTPYDKSEWKMFPVEG